MHSIIIKSAKHKTGAIIPRKMEKERMSEIAHVRHGNENGIQR